MKEFLILVIFILLVLGGLGWYFGYIEFSMPERDSNENITQQEENMMGEEEMTQEEMKEPTEILGISTKGHDITAYHFWGSENTEDEILFIGGIHGGYSWNTTLVAYELIDYLEENEDVVPDNLEITVIPVLNPDGLEEVVGTTLRFEPSDVSGDTVAGRFNGNGVDLNRNFDCNWSENATWRSESVDPGIRAFSEPESRALRDYVDEHDIRAAVVWYSAAGGVYESRCNGDSTTAETTELMNIFADASGYPAEGYFDAYALTGDAVDWLAKEGIPAVSVILETHDDVEWEKNMRGVEAILEEYGN